MPSSSKSSRSGACIFCEIVAGRAPASLVAENPASLAFLTIGPLRPGHALVIPKRHAVALPDATPAELAAMIQLVAEVAQRQRRLLNSEGETLFVASGEAGEQSVFHLHLHIVPRLKGDGLDLTSWWEARITQVARADLDATAAKLRGE